MPQITSPTTYLNPPSLARQLGVKPDTIRAWIATGQLHAVNLAVRQGGRARWRISAQALSDFLHTRQAFPPPPKPARRKRTANIVDFFPNVPQA